jgi:hypothetical protein
MKPQGRPGVKRRLTTMGDYGWQHSGEEVETDGRPSNGKEQQPCVRRVPTAPPG